MFPNVEYRKIAKLAFIVVFCGRSGLKIFSDDLELVSRLQAHVFGAYGIVADPANM